MASRCWKDVNDRISDENYVEMLTNGVKYVPKHLAFLYCGQKLLAASANSNNRHAEENIIEKFKNMRDLSINKPYRIYVIKLSGAHSMSRPCADCSNTIAKFCPRARVYYTNYDGKLVEDRNLDNTHRSLRRTGRRKLVATDGKPELVCCECS
tara:strand:+ start:173 stop:631 length:459 start_codon:yes stop_codon:yes gene_type:complete